MAGLPFDPIAAIREHSAGLADAAVGNLDARVDSCPGWSVADLVWHVTEVHWFWATIVAERLSAPPGAARRPARPPEERLVDAFRQGADRLQRVLASTDGSEPVWTWAPAQQDAAFVLRHQVQEAAVHHWDAATAAHRSVVIDPVVAADAVEEFLTFSVSSDADPAEPLRPSLQGAFAMKATDAGAAWTLRDGGQPGTVAVVPGCDEAVSSFEATASDLLLWLYGRIALDTRGVEPELLARFRALCYTD